MDQDHARAEKHNNPALSLFLLVAPLFLVRQRDALLVSTYSLSLSALFYPSCSLLISISFSLFRRLSVFLFLSPANVYLLSFFSSCFDPSFFSSCFDVLHRWLSDCQGLSRALLVHDARSQLLLPSHCLCLFSLSRDPHFNVVAFSRQFSTFWFSATVRVSMALCLLLYIHLSSESRAYSSVPSLPYFFRPLWASCVVLPHSVSCPLKVTASHHSQSDTTCWMPLHISLVQLLYARASRVSMSTTFDGAHRTAVLRVENFTSQFHLFHRGCLFSSLAPAPRNPSPPYTGHATSTKPNYSQRHAGMEPCALLALCL